MNSIKDKPLPENWSMKYDFMTKRNFFINHKTKETTWDDPRQGTKKINEDTYIGCNDFIEDSDMEKVIQLIGKESEIQKQIDHLCEKIPGFERNYIKELLIKSKGNVSTVEVKLRQERRKETSSILSYSTIESGSSKHKMIQGENTRFSLSERNKYDAPESSREKVKSKLRSEFADVDSRIVDRVLQVTDYSPEESRNILLSKNIPTDSLAQEKYHEKGKDSKTKEDLPSFKNFVRRQISNSTGDSGSGKKCYNGKKSLAVGPDPKNRSGSQLNRYIHK